ncbi:MAG TPA: DUF402 domain-containing protein [Ktedonobacterales bacterium]|nr:DUF402 domain-containing protein [Ktedonobacterales bacterium]
MKRKRANRDWWPRLVASRFVVTRLDTADFSGMAALLALDALSEPLVVTACGETLTVADSGYTWLHHFPADEPHYTLTTMFDVSGALVQGYVDICAHHGLDPDGVPYHDDLYLDIAVTAEGEAEILDAADLDAALRAGSISAGDHTLAWREAERVLAAIRTRHFPLLALAPAHRKLLLPRL